jgi:hypothetical protein
MFLQKIKNRTSAVLIYGVTPPKLETPLEKVLESAQRSIARLQTVNLDALIVYDVQDESTRTKEARPFPFQPAMDPMHYAVNYLADLNLPKIIYRPAGKYTQLEIADWFLNMHQNNLHPVLVGIPSPDYVPKISLPEAYQLWSDYQEKSVMGAICIPERHVVLKDEDQRILDKVKSGVSYFVTQCVFNEEYTIAMLEALKEACQKSQQALPTIIFTLSTCGSLKTVEFMEWLGIHIADAHKQRMQTAEDILQESLQICFEVAQTLANYCALNDIPYGFNIESVAIRKNDVEASFALLEKVNGILKSKAVVSQL